MRNRFWTCTLLTGAVLAGVVTACGPRTEGPSTPSTATAEPDQSTIFFPTSIDTYGMSLGQSDRERLAELYALRQIDPCGFVDAKTIAANGHNNFSYNLDAVAAVLGGGVSPIAPLGDRACTVAFPDSTVALSVQVRPGEPRFNDDQFANDSTRPGVATRTSGTCGYRVALPLTNMAGAPASMRDPFVEISATGLPGHLVATDNPAVCELGGALASDIITRAGQGDIPVRSDDTLLSADPCTAATDLDAVGFDWDEPAPIAQWRWERRER